MAADSLSNKVILLTGGASGIGLATAKQLLKRGAHLYVCDINQKALDDAATALGSGPSIRYDNVDVTDREAVKAAIASTKAHFGRLDAVASIAGTGGHRLGHDFVWETSSDEYGYIMDVNVRSTFNVLSETLVPGVIEEPNGSVVCVGSMFSRQGFEKGAVFAASKHAMVGMVKSAAKEVGRRGIRVNAVLP